MIAIALAGLLGTVHPICGGSIPNIQTTEGCFAPQTQAQVSPCISGYVYDWAKEHCVIEPSDKPPTGMGPSMMKEWWACHDELPDCPVSMVPIMGNISSSLLLDAPPCGTPEAKEWGVCTKWTIRSGMTAEKLWKGPQ